MEKNYLHEFIDRYHQLETYLMECYGYEVGQAEEENLFDLHHQLQACRNLRNVISHNFIVDKNGLETIVVRKPFLDLIDDVYKKITSDALAFGVSMEDGLYWVTPETPVCEVIKTMNSKHYTHVPILNENKKLYGVFSENTLFKIHLTDISFVLTEDTLMRDIKEFVEKPLEGYDTVMILDDSTSYRKCAEIFNTQIKDQERTDIVLITSDGTRYGNLLGLITAWDCEWKVGK